MKSHIPSPTRPNGVERADADRARSSRPGYSVTTDFGLVQRRIGLTYGLFALLLAGVFVVGTVALHAFAPAQVWTIDVSKVTYLASIAILAAVWMLCRRNQLLPHAILGVADGGGLFSLIALLAVTATYAPSGLRAEYVGTTLFALVVTLRAALVPSPPAWTVLVSAVAAIPLPIGA